MTRTIMAAFNQGAVPTIACINSATVDLQVDFNRLVGALQTFLDDCFAPIWGAPAKIVKADAPVEGAWTIVFLDKPDAPNALGYHDLTKNGLPLSKVFVETILNSREKVSVTACHELCEMLIDPAINLWCEGPNGLLYAYEMCDAVEAEEFEVDGIAMSDFVYPAYFENFRAPHSAQFDYLKKVSRPFEILKHGYSIIRDGNKIRNIFGSREKQESFAREDRTEHRSEYRKEMLVARPVNTAELRAATPPPPPRLQFDVANNGTDLAVSNVRATWFGGPNDPQDSGETASGVNTRLHPDIVGCALPMDGFHHASTDGSPLPKLPWNIYVRVRNRATGKELSVPLIDLGPSLTAPSRAAIDLTEAAFKLLGGKPSDGTMQVDFVIPGGARYVPHGQPARAGVLWSARGNGAGSRRAMTAGDGHGEDHDVPKPTIKREYDCRHFSSRNGTPIDMVVLHYTDGPSAQSAINHFMDKDTRVSAHYIIDKNGDIYQMVQDSEAAWHAKSANRRSIGIEHVAQTGDHMTAAQERSSVALIKWLIATYDVPLQNILGHQYAPGNIGTTDCPAHLFGEPTKAAVDAWVTANFGPHAHAAREAPGARLDA